MLAAVVLAVVVLAVVVGLELVVVLPAGVVVD